MERGSNRFLFFIFGEELLFVNHILEKIYFFNQEKDLCIYIYMNIKSDQSYSVF